jgi:putative nucleotidyltransferase with HDIG domain
MRKQQIEQFWQELVADIQANRVVLPSLPDVALKVRKLIDTPGTPAARVAAAISADAVLTTRLLRMVNSPLYRTSQTIDNVQAAVTRLGNVNVRNLVTSLAMEQLYQVRVSTEHKKRMLARHREHGMMVAALSWFIARNYTALNAEESMLAGLIHDIGKLPLIEYAELAPDIANDEDAMERLIEILHPRVGVLMLRSWSFPVEMATAVAEHENLHRDPGTPPDHTDVVIVANLLSYIGTDHPHTRHDWSSIPAFRRLAITPEESIDAMKNAKEQIHGVRLLLAA